MSNLLPIGTYVIVRDPGCVDHEDRSRQILPAQTYYAVIVGYDVFRSKYEVGRRYVGWGRYGFMSGGTWPFPQWCEEVTEGVATILRETP